MKDTAEKFVPSEDREFHVGDIVQHFKREIFPGNGSEKNYLYRIVAFSKSTETCDEMVTYESLYGDYGLWTRNLHEFLSEVDKDCYPTVSQKYRFVKMILASND